MCCGYRREAFVESKLLKRLPSDIGSWRGGMEELFLECVGLDYCILTEDGGGSGRWRAGWRCPRIRHWRLGGLLRPMFRIELDLVLQGWWLSWLNNALWIWVSWSQRMYQYLVLVFFIDGEGVCLVVAAMAVCNNNTVCNLLLLCFLYTYQLCIIMFILSNVCLRAYIIKINYPLFTSINIEPK
jgi:hypothetical protein